MDPEGRNAPRRHGVRAGRYEFVSWLICPPTLLQKNGVERVLFASGSLDLSHAHMVEEARRLGAHGTTTTFMSLGPVGHTFARDMDAWANRAFDWLSTP